MYSLNDIGLTGSTFLDRCLYHLAIPLHVVGGVGLEPTVAFAGDFQSIVFAELIHVCILCYKLYLVNT